MNLNPILHLKGRFEQRANPNKPGKPELPKKSVICVEHIHNLKKQLQEILKYWSKNTEINGALVSVHYKRIVAKSNRLGILLSYPSHLATDSIRGAKFVWEPDQDGKTIQKHVFTHYVPHSAITKAIKLLEVVEGIVERHYGGKITEEEANKINTQSFAHRNLITANNFIKVLRDCWYVERFDIDHVSEEVQDDRIITIYQTDIDTKQLLSKFGIHIVDDRILDGTTIRLYPDEVNQLIQKAGYLISMNVTDLSQLSRDHILKDEPVEDDLCNILESPANEPIVGVIDTQFDEKVYFHEWVEYHKLVDENIPLAPEDFHHGTAVSSIIVDGPRGNPGLEDGCGHFRVRHFGVATHTAFSSFTILRQIRSIVSSNRDIKVWNLSLGSQLEIKENSISPEGAELDRIQNEYDVIFVVAGTNKASSEKDKMKIGAPADSLNSLVVNSVDFNGKPASYTRVGPVLSFFYKPDVSFYGGDGKDREQRIVVCKDSMGASFVTGTSFAAPWITRKMAYLIYIMGLSKEVAKALIIDAAAGWNSKDDLSHTVGYGIVPKHINDIIHTSDDEIRFILTGTTDSYETYTYNLPVPVVNNAHPFYARATLVYFPQCNRNQGVDYTNTEMDIHFGRIKIVKGKPQIKPIDNNKQAEEGLHVIYEENARREYRKWDNIKHICEEIKAGGRPRKSYESGLWGLSIKTKERLTNRKKDKLPFGVVVTLKEMNGVNRMDEFIKLCMARGWLVNQLDVENRLDIYAKLEEEIVFD